MMVRHTSRTLSLLLGVAVCCVATLQPATAASRAERCASIKMRLAGSTVRTILASCHARAVQRDRSIDPSCIERAEAKLQRAYARYDDRGGCATTGDASAVLARAATLVSDVATALPDGGTLPGRRCAAKKLRAAGIKTKERARCHARALRRSEAPEQRCLDRAANRFERFFLRAEFVGGCFTLDDADPIEAIIDQFTDIDLPGLLPVTTPTATVPATSTPVASATATTVPTSTATATPVPATATSTALPPATATATALASATPVASATSVATPTASPSPSTPPTATSTPPPTASPSPVATATSTVAATSTATPSATSAPTESPTAAATATATVAATNTIAPTATATATTSPSPSATATLPAVVKRVFVTQQPVSANISGIAGADTKCQIMANAARLGGTWTAWLSCNSCGPGGTPLDAIDRIGEAAYRLLDGTLVASSRADLTDGSLLHPIDLDEHLGTVTNQPVWTGTDAAGRVVTTAGPVSSTCLDWTSSRTSPEAGAIGSSSATGPAWTLSTEVPCSNMARLYCFEQ